MQSMYQKKVVIWVFVHANCQEVHACLEEPDDES